MIGYPKIDVWLSIIRFLDIHNSLRPIDIHKSQRLLDILNSNYGHPQTRSMNIQYLNKSFIRFVDILILDIHNYFEISQNGLFEYLISKNKLWNE